MGRRPIKAQNDAVDDEIHTNSSISLEDSL